MSKAQESQPPSFNGPGWRSKSGETLAFKTGATRAKSTERSPTKLTRHIWKIASLFGQEGNARRPREWVREGRWEMEGKGSRIRRVERGGEGEVDGAQ
jgi:hypothetical protein